MPPIDLSSLNPAQLEATLATEGPLLVLAGAGSGKTRVLTYRIAHIIENLGFSPYQILAITFTNKAAAEMRERLSQLLTHRARGMWVSTFHSMCVRILRADAELVGYSTGFSIYDEYDMKRLMKDVFAELNISEKTISPNYVRELISKAKNELVGPLEYASESKVPYQREVARVYQRLAERLLQADAMDFDDLLFNAWRLLAENPQVLQAYQQRFRYILVDEYQDTNHAQYALTSLLAAAHQNIMVVGDDDQSIYSWRGADIRNILDFEQDYPDAQVVKLEQNYRSTARILDVANAVIAKNQSRKPKRLYTEGSQGEKIALYMASNERDEGRWIASEIAKLHRQGRPYTDFAVFYRTNAQSRVIEDRLVNAGLPYRIIGGTRFFDRAEIRDVMAYLKLIANPADEVAAKRIVNVPRRGLGSKSVAQINDLALSKGLSFFGACEQILDGSTLSAKAHQALSQFVGLINEARSYRGSLRDIVEMVVERSGYLEYLAANRTEEGLSRIENVYEFFGVVQEFSDSYTEEAEVIEGLEGPADAGEVDGPDAGTFTVDEGFSPNGAADEKLLAFMEWLALRSDLDSLDEGTDYVTLMTVHSAKGLEFDVVFIAGMEDGLFPHFASLDNAGGLEEERRLAYVAITRARELLYISYAHMRNIFGETQLNTGSMFINDIPDECISLQGVGSQGFSGVGWEKRGDRQGIYGSGTDSEASGRVYGSSRAFDQNSYATLKPPTNSLNQSSQPRPDIGLGSNADDNSKPNPRNQQQAQELFSVGDYVDHKVFGSGKVVSIKGDTLDIFFDRLNKTKTLAFGYAPIVKIERQ